MQRQSKHEFFHSGHENQKTPDVVFDFRYKGSMNPDKWTGEEKENSLKWIERVKQSFELFAEELTELINQKQPI